MSSLVFSEKVLNYSEATWHVVTLPNPRNGDGWIHACKEEIHRQKPEITQRRAWPWKRGRAADMIIVLDFNPKKVKMKNADIVTRICQMLREGTVLRKNFSVEKFELRENRGLDKDVILRFQATSRRSEGIEEERT